MIFGKRDRQHFICFLYSRLMLSKFLGNNVISSSSRIWLLIQVTKSCDFLLKRFTVSFIHSEGAFRFDGGMSLVQDHLRSKIFIVQTRTSASWNILMWLGQIYFVWHVIKHELERSLINRLCPKGNHFHLLASHGERSQILTHVCWCYSDHNVLEILRLLLLIFLRNDGKEWMKGWTN